MIHKDQTPDYLTISFEAGSAFNPNSPVSEADLFSGRIPQIQRIIDVIFQRGQHAVIFGERGVGKTSLANVLEKFFPSSAKSLLVTRINCDSADTFKTVWKKVFDHMQLTSQSQGLGFMPENKTTPFRYDTLISDEESAPEQVRNLLVQLSQSTSPVIIIDEFDRLNLEARRLFADFIKGLSDFSIQCTVILIGVGSSVEDLINEHLSISRSLSEVQMPRMAPNEIEGIIDTGLSRLNMTMEIQAKKEIITLSKGLPHYTHLICLKAVRIALAAKELHITKQHLNSAIEKAIEDSQHSIRTDYHKAIRSTKKENLFEDVLLACALVNVNELGEFAAQDLRAPLKKITKRSLDIPNYQTHLNEFCDEKRGNILVKTGDRKRFRYKFSDPLMQPFIIMKGMACGKLTDIE